MKFSIIVCMVVRYNQLTGYFMEGSNFNHCLKISKTFFGLERVSVKDRKTVKFAGSLDS